MGKRALDDGEAIRESEVVTQTNATKSKKRKTKKTELELVAIEGSENIEISKEERRKLRRLKKLDKDQSIESHAGTQNVEQEEATADQNAQVEDDKTTRAARKAEKARLKAAKRSERGQKNENLIPPRDPLSKESSYKGGQPPPTALSKGSSIELSYMEDPVLTALPQSEIDAFLGSNFIKIIDPQSSSPLRPILNFSHLPTFSSSVISPFANFKSPTPIQAAAWPFILSNRDVIGVAETGSGKTLAFGVPCVRSISATLSQKRHKEPTTKAVIVSPTRELAVQIHDQISQLASPVALNTVCIYGGVPKDPQRLALPRAHIIVGTPGRLNDLISEGAADLSGVTYLVLDEADRMLDKGFEDDIRKIIGCTPTSAAGRQTLMFTATWPESVRALAATFMQSPVHISIGRDNPTGALRANAAITQRVEVIEPAAKESRLLQLIKAHQKPGTAQADDRILVFCLYKKEAARVENFLRAKLEGGGSSRTRRVAAIHGDMAQPARSASLDAFRSGTCPILVATDVAARGLDIPAVKLVLNMTFPLTVEDYVHRIGRFVSPFHSPYFPLPHSQKIQNRPRRLHRPRNHALHRTRQSPLRQPHQRLESSRPDGS